MNEPSSAPPLEYLTEVLAANPLQDAAAILRRRARQFGLGGPPSAQSPAVGEEGDREARQRRRQRLAERIEQIRDEFWSLPMTGVKSRLEKLDAREFPELQAAVERLRHVTLHRGDFPQLLEHKQANLSLFNFLKKVVVLPRREAGQRKERFLRQAAAAGSLKDIQRMARVIKRQFPDIYRLEPSWLDQLIKLRPNQSVDEEGAAALGGEFEMAMPPWLIVMIVVFVLRALMVAMG